MTSAIPSSLETTAPADSSVVNPYLHIDPDRIYNPLTDAALVPGEDGFDDLQAVAGGSRSTASVDSVLLGRLLGEEWLVPREADLSNRYRLKLVSLETNTVCNQKCYFCPVSVDPREDYAMPDSLFNRILEELTAYRETIDAVFLQSYNEPTVDRRFVDHIKAILAAGLPAAVLSNGSAFTPAKVDAILAAGSLRFMSINLSTLDPQRYLADRGADHLAIVLRHLDYMKDLPLAQQMNIVVLGPGDDQHRSDFYAIRDRFAGSRFDVQFHVVMDRAGYLPVGLRPEAPHEKLRGCDNIGSRPLQHIHITPQGKTVLCCEDYDENYVVGDLTTQTIHEVLSGPVLAQMKRWAYGIEEAPADFMCRNCVFARTSSAT